MAATIFKALLEERGLRIDVSSAGVAAVEGAAMDPNAVTSLEEVGLYPGPHSARRVRRELIEGSSLVLAMTPRQIAKLRRDFPGYSEFHTLPSYAAGAPEHEGISDPHGGPILGYRATVRQLLGLLELLADRLDARSAE